MYHKAPLEGNALIIELAGGISQTEFIIISLSELIFVTFGLFYPTVKCDDRLFFFTISYLVDFVIVSRTFILFILNKF